MQSNIQVCVCYLMNTVCVYVLVWPTVESDGMSEGQNSDVPAVVVNVTVYKGQVAAVVNNGVHLRHVGVDWFTVDGAELHTPAIKKAMPPSVKKKKKIKLIQHLLKK